MAITLKQKENFIDLRSDGLSFDTIAKKLNISKNTLINLQIELEEEISNATFFKYQTILEKYKLTKINRVESHSKLFEKVMKEIESRDLTKLSFKDLLSFKEDIKNNLNILSTYKTDNLEKNDFGMTSNKTFSLD